jgi:hypothetical protein
MNSVLELISMHHIKNIEVGLIWEDLTDLLVRRNSKSKSTGELEQIMLPMPSIFRVYSKFMGGTDLVDQLISYYLNNTKTYKWPVRVFTYFLFASIVNAHILFKEHGLRGLSEEVKKRNPGYALLDFMHALMKQCITETIWTAIMSRNSLNTSIQPRHLSGRFGQSPTLAQAVMTHSVSIHLLKKKFMQNKIKRIDNRRACRECGANTGFVCGDCEGEPPLCSTIKSDGTNCAKKFHLKLKK